MQRSGVQAVTSPFIYSNSPLLPIINTLQSSYWSNPQEGVFEFQFLNPSQPLDNTSMNIPYYFHLIRHTPTYNYDSFAFTIQGRLNGDGTFEYGDGRLGTIKGDRIVWTNGLFWNKVAKVPEKDENLIDLNLVQKQAYGDSIALGNIVNRNYYY